MVSFLAGINLFRFWPKCADCIVLYIVLSLDQISLHTHNSLLDGTMELKSASFREKVALKPSIIIYTSMQSGDLSESTYV